jgi:hypothetical protein
MKRFTLALMYTGIAVLALIWALGCSSDVSGPTGGNFYTLQLSLTRPTMHNYDPSDTVICWVQDSQSNVVFGAKLRFSTRSPNGQTAPTASNSDTLGTGTNPVVRYTANGVLDTIDWIYAALLTDNLVDTLVLDSISVRILP